jgi:hypothetical protein
MKKLSHGLVALARLVKNDSELESDWVCAAGNGLLHDLKDLMRCEHYSRGVLRIVVSNKAWCDQVKNMAPEFKANLNRLAGKKLVDTVEAYVNNRAFSRKKHHNKHDKEIQLSQASPEIKEAAAQIKDTSVRNAFIKLGMKLEKLEKTR